MSDVEAIRKRKTKMINVQRHQKSCGPVAIANVIKWYGVETSYQKVLEWCLATDMYDPDHGMWPRQTRFVLLQLQVPFRKYRSFTAEDIDRWLALGQSLILIYDTKTSGSHAAFIDAASETSYRIWNRKMGSTQPWHSKEYVRQAIERTNANNNGLFAFVFEPGDRV